MRSVLRLDTLGSLYVSNCRSINAGRVTGTFVINSRKPDCCKDHITGTEYALYWSVDIDFSARLEDQTGSRHRSFEHRSRRTLKEGEDRDVGSTEAPTSSRGLVRKAPDSFDHDSDPFIRTQALVALLA